MVISIFLLNAHRGFPVETIPLHCTQWLRKSMKLKSGVATTWLPLLLRRVPWPCFASSAATMAIQMSPLRASIVNSLPRSKDMTIHEVKITSWLTPRAVSTALCTKAQKVPARVLDHADSSCLVMQCHRGFIMQSHQCPVVQRRSADTFTSP